MGNKKRRKTFLSPEQTNFGLHYAYKLMLEHINTVEITDETKKLFLLILDLDEEITEVEVNSILGGSTSLKRKNSTETLQRQTKIN